MKIQWNRELKAKILLPKQMQRTYPSIPDRLTVKIGQWIKEVRAEFKSESEDGTIDIPLHLSGGLTISDQLQYEMKLDNNTLAIGPVIAIVVQKRRDLRSLLDEHKVYFSDYGNLKGLLYVCTEDGIDKSNGTIEGYSYNPYRKDGDCWECGVFPFPQVVFQRHKMKKDTLNAFMSADCKVFNEYFFNKWEFWQWMKPHHHVKEHIPQTKKLKNLENLDQMLAIHGKVMLKPVQGSLGIGIIQAEKSTLDGYRFVCPLDKDSIPIIHRFAACPSEQERLIEKIEMEKCVIYHKQVQRMEEARQFVNDLKKYHYLVQQAIMTKKYKNRCVDFRVILQKGKEKRWKTTAIIARAGKEESVISNFTFAGFALPAKEAFKTVFQLNEAEAKEKEKEIFHVCRNACEILEQHGAYGDVGIDVILDHDLNVWIIEINNRHFHDYPLFALHDQKLYRKVCTTPMKYAKALAGF